MPFWLVFGESRYAMTFPICKSYLTIDFRVALLHHIFEPNSQRGLTTSSFQQNQNRNHSMNQPPNGFATKHQEGDFQLVYLVKEIGTNTQGAIITIVKHLVRREGQRKPGQPGERLAFDVFDQMSTDQGVIDRDGKVNERPFFSFNEALALARKQAELAGSNGWRTFDEYQKAKKKP